MWSARNLIATVLLIFFGICFMTGGIITIIIFPSLFHKGIVENKILTPESQTYAQWVEPTIPIYLKFNFFNCTNIENFIKYEEKPQLEELGPYVFRELREKVNISEIDNTHIEYMQKKSWVFDPELSNGSLSDIVRTINVPVGAAGYTSRHKLRLEKLITSTAIQVKLAEMFVQRTVDQFLFEGYNDPMLDFGNSLVNLTNKVLPEKFGFYYKKNGTLDGPYVINNGREDIQNVGYIESYKNSSIIEGFGDYCNFINGTAADVFPPFMYDNKKLEFFASDLCRSLTFEYKERVDVNGVEARRFVPEPFLLDNGDHVESKKCFCTGECNKYGVLNISSCQDGAPIFISFPHFLDADESYRNNVEGMNPDREKHQFVMDIQPDLGIPINVQGRFQINVLIQQVKDFHQFKHFQKSTYFPMLWFEQTARIDEEQTDKLIYLTKKLPSYVKAAAFSMIGIGILLIVIAIVLNLYLFFKTPKPQKSEGKTYELAPSKEIITEQMKAKEKEALK